METDTHFQMLTAYTTVVVVCLLGAFFLLIAYRILTGAINTTGLLIDKTTGGLSPARVQLCLLSLSGAFYYLMTVVDLVQTGTASDLSLPAPPKELLALVLGSNTIYITAKANSAAQQNPKATSAFR